MGNSCEPSTMCYRMRPLIYATGNLTFTMQASITNSITRIYNLIPDISNKATQRRLQPRGLIDGIGQVSSWLFGLTTEAETRDLRDAILKVKNIVQTVAADAAHVKDLFTAFTTLESERMDNMKQILQQESKSMSVLYEEIRRVADSSHIEYNSLTMLTIELAKFVQLHDSLQQLETGIEDLLHGMLTPKLIGVQTISEMLANVTSTLNEQSYELCFRTPQEVYASQTFDYARHESSLIVRLRIPFSRFRPMNLYRTIILPMPVSGEQHYVTQLRNIPKYVITNLALGIVGEVDEQPQTAVIDDIAVKWHKPYSKSCVYELLTDNPQMVSENCDFSTYRQVIEPSYIRLAKGVYILMNMTKVRASCPEGRHYNLTSQNCNPCIATVECGCELHVGNEVIAAEAQMCVRLDIADSKLQHAVNLIVLQEFHELTN